MKTELKISRIISRWAVINGEKPISRQSVSKYYKFIAAYIDEVTLSEGKEMARKEGGEIAAEDYDLQYRNGKMTIFATMRNELDNTAFYRSTGFYAPDLDERERAVYMRSFYKMTRGTNTREFQDIIIRGMYVSGLMVEVSKGKKKNEIIDEFMRMITAVLEEKPLNRDELHFY